MATYTLIGFCVKVISYAPPDGNAKTIIFKGIKKSETNINNNNNNNSNDDNDIAINPPKKKMKIEPPISDLYMITGFLCDVITSPLLNFEIEVTQMPSTTDSDKINDRIAFKLNKIKPINNTTYFMFNNIVLKLRVNSRRSILGGNASSKVIFFI